jgi:hypothetical protein
VEGDEELTCSRVTDTEKLLHDTLVSANRDILHLLRVSLKERKKERKKKLACAPLAHSSFLNSSRLQFCSIWPGGARTRLCSRQS